MEKSKNKRYIAIILNSDIAGGLLMILFAIIALALASSNFASKYNQIIHFTVPVNLKFMQFNISFKDFVQEILMSGFFLLVSMELKREMYEGVLKDRDQIILPLVAALGGMIIPVIIYIIINWNYPQYYSGAAVPCATDIAFAMCVFNLVGRSLPNSAKICLLSLAIFDDIGAILIITFFYNKQFLLFPLLCVVVGALLLFFLNYKKIVNITYYILLFVLMGVFLHKAGIHSTISGVIMGFSIPLYDKNNKSPLKKGIALIHPWVSYGVLPVFAFTACDINIMNLKISDLLHPVSLGVFTGLFFGKQLGVFLSIWLMVKKKIASMPQSCNWVDVYFVSCISGIGFTVCLFINELAFELEEIRNLAKAGIIFASIIAAAWGSIIIKFKALK